MFSRVRLAWCWTIVILALCWFPRAYMGVNERGPRPFFVPNIDKVVHLGIFAGFSFLWGRVGFSKFRGPWILITGLILAVVTEVVQEAPFINRDASVGDVLADAAGVVLGLSAVEIARRYQDRRAMTPEV